MTHPKKLSRAVAAVIGAGAIALPGAAGLFGADAAAANPNTPRDAGRLAAHLLDQDITWETCNFGRPVFDAVPGLGCANITVPRDWNNPTDGNTITVRVSRTQTAGANRQGIALVNPGGPGGSGLIWGPAMAVRAPELAQQFDFYGFDPRGVGQSTPLVCTYTPTAGASYENDQRDRVNGCLENPLTPFINTDQTAHDMDFIRALMGEDKLSYVGYSYGTWLGSWYQRTFPQHSHRFLLDSATDLTRKSLQETWDLQPRSRDRHFQEMFLPYVGRNAELFDAPSNDPRELREYWERAGGNRELLGQIISANYILPAMYNNTDYPTAAVLAAYYMGTALPQGADIAAARAALIDITNQAAGSGRLDATQVERLREMEANALRQIDEKIATDAAAQNGTPVRYNMTFEAIRCQDGEWNKSSGYWNAWLADLDRKAPWIAPFMDAPACRFWPAATEMPNPRGNSLPQSIIVQSEFDAATPYEAGERSARQLNNTSFIAVDNEGSHGLYPYGTECVDTAIETYFLTGRTPGNRTVCGAVPLPLENQVFPVGADLGAPGQNHMKMRSDAVKEANRIVDRVLADQTPNN
ncbi:MAG: alpha/beta fold hydrolase [Mobilicoccus sp.]|nr:alpha/beta fold hydrolase [Mobilicoccus sp.]